MKSFSVLAAGVDQAIPFKEIKKAKYSNVSLMPEVFDHLLKPNEIADLVAYLKEAKGPVDPFHRRIFRLIMRSTCPACMPMPRRA